MIFIVVKFPVRPERVDDWLDAVADFTAATRAEPGNIMFEWSRSVDDETEFVLVEAFRDGEAGVAHVKSSHFSQAVAVMAELVSEVPKIINGELPAEGWSAMAEVQPSHR
ncbi:MAG: antibiotic biosynthesis monooxygenase [Frankiales bacterium]|nr:antibiotic biosynthesis monooxygenase [Frankiales bacterium]